MNTRWLCQKCYDEAVEHYEHELEVLTIQNLFDRVDCYRCKERKAKHLTVLPQYKVTFTDT